MVSSNVIYYKYLTIVKENHAIYVIRRTLPQNVILARSNSITHVDLLKMQPSYMMPLWEINHFVMSIHPNRGIN